MVEKVRFLPYSADFYQVNFGKNGKWVQKLHFNTVYYYKAPFQACQVFFRHFVKNYLFMRIDKFLKVSRILKRRTLAQEACDKGKVTVNGKAVKSGHKIKVGDIVEITYTESSVKFRIKEIRETVKKDDASSLYEII